MLGSTQMSGGAGNLVKNIVRFYSFSIVKLENIGLLNRVFSVSCFHPIKSLLIFKAASS